METKLPAIHDGDDAEVKLMAGGVVLKGKVEGLSRAIADPDAAGGGLLASVDPEFESDRLAQRIPVRIRLESVATRRAAGVGAFLHGRGQTRRRRVRRGRPKFPSVIPAKAGHPGASDGHRTCGPWTPAFARGDGREGAAPGQ